MMYTVIERVLYVHTLGGCHRWVSMKLKFVLVQLVAYIEKCSIWYCNSGTVAKACMHVCGPTILPTIGLCNL